MTEKRKSSHQPYGNIDEVLDADISFDDFFTNRQLDKVRDAVNAEIEAEKSENSKP